MILDYGLRSNKKITMIKKIYFVLSLLILLQACEKNIEEDHKVVFQDCSQVEAYYSESVLPIMKQSCITCHSGTNPSGNLLLTEFTSVKTSMGKTLDRVNREEGSAGFMPLGGEKLTNSDLGILQTFFEMDCVE